MDNLSVATKSLLTSSFTMLAFVYDRNNGVLPETPEYHQMDYWLGVLELARETGTLTESITTEYINSVIEYVNTI